jgi:hypothetical protein
VPPLSPSISINGWIAISRFRQYPYSMTPDGTGLIHSRETAKSGTDLVSYGSIVRANQ